MRNRQLRRYSRDKSRRGSPQSHFCMTRRTKQNSTLAGPASHHSNLCSLASGDKVGVSELGFDQTLTSAYEALQQSGFSLEPLLGTFSARVFLVGDGQGEQFAVVGCCGSYAERVEILSRIKGRWPFMRVIAIQQHTEEPLAGADISIAGEFDVSLLLLTPATA